MTQKEETADLAPAIADENGVAIRPALEVLARLRRGQVMDLLSLELNRIVNAVKDNESGKGGSVSLTLKIDPIKKVVNAVQIQAVVVGKAPEDPPRTDIFWYDDDGNLHTSDPNQADLFGGPRGV